jgi:hypothetical protein
MLEVTDENHSFPHKDITEKIIGAAFEVYKCAELIFATDEHGFTQNRCLR